MNAAAEPGHPTRSSHHLHHRTTGRALTLLGLIVCLGFGAVADAAAQNRRTRNRRPQREDPNLPQQRTPLPASELNLGALPYKIVFESLRTTGGESNWELMLVNPDGSGLRNITNTPNIDEHYPHASPDGARILFVAIQGESRRDRTRSVWVMGLDGSNRVKVADNAYQPNWSGDGKSIAYAPGEYDRFNSDMTANQGVVIYDLETGATRTHPEDDLEQLYNLTWSPDGQWFVSTVRSGRRGNILFNASSAGIRSLSIDGCRPDFSPDGTRIAWGRTDQELRIGTFDPSNSRENVVDQRPVVAVDRSDKVYHVDWSPDGRFLAFSYGPSRGGQAVGQRAEGWNLSIYDIAQEKWVRITTDGNHNKEPDWVPVGGGEE